MSEAPELFLQDFEHAGFGRFHIMTQEGEENAMSLSICQLSCHFWPHRRSCKQKQMPVRTSRIPLLSHQDAMTIVKFLNTHSDVNKTT